MARPIPPPAIFGLEKEDSIDVVIKGEGNHSRKPKHSPKAQYTK